MTCRMVSFVLFLLLASSPGLAVSKEVIELQIQAEETADQMARTQVSFDRSMNEMHSLIEQEAAAVNQMKDGMRIIRTAVNQEYLDSAHRADQISRQIQALGDSLHEAKVRVATLSKQMDLLASQQHSITQGAAAVIQLQVPSADVLYRDALSDYEAGRLDMASQEFSSYLKYYPLTGEAGDAQFYRAEIEYGQGNFAAAVKDYKNVLERYAGGSKMAAAQLKTGLALIQLGQQRPGARELEGVIDRYPGSVEASIASRQLRKLKLPPSRS